ncbi:hypothetical protein EVAR_43693_1 [Eumeta japonica]|uniref:Uncharacterized protein n=1 Tax=Eumeta variegata TaxID=151549 RepID=A0A4C1WYY1_EUMVA|nr:hypothetical protein EVAR_43693_1 [Eumeta japonica]
MGNNRIFNGGVSGADGGEKQEWETGTLTVRLGMPKHYPTGVCTAAEVAFFGASGTRAPQRSQLKISLTIGRGRAAGFMPLIKNSYRRTSHVPNSKRMTALYIRHLLTLLRVYVPPGLGVTQVYSAGSSACDLWSETGVEIGRSRRRPGVSHLRVRAHRRRPITLITGQDAFTRPDKAEPALEVAARSLQRYDFETRKRTSLYSEIYC